MIGVGSAALAPGPWGVGAAELRLPLDEFAAVAKSIPGLVLPEGFRPGRRTQPVSSPEIAQSLAKRRLLLRDGDDVVLCPQLTGLLRLFERAALTLRLRVRLRGTDDDTHVRWLTDVALAEGRGVRLTRATLPAAGGAGGDGAMDGEVVAISGFTIAEAVPQLLGCVPGLVPDASVDPDERPDRQTVDVVDFAARGREEDRGAMSLETRSRAGYFVDVWSHDGHAWRSILPDDAGRLVVRTVRRKALAAHLTDVLSESVLVDGSATATERVDGRRVDGRRVDGRRVDGDGRGE